jgi:hypothetical protein
MWGANRSGTSIRNERATERNRLGHGGWTIIQASQAVAVNVDIL